MGGWRDRCFCQSKHASHYRACILGFPVWPCILVQKMCLPPAMNHIAQQSHARAVCIGGICGSVLLLSCPKYSRSGIIGQPAYKYCMIFNDSKGELKFQD